MDSVDAIGNVVTNCIKAIGRQFIYFSRMKRLKRRVMSLKS